MNKLDTDLTTLICWGENDGESILTCSMSNEQIQELEHCQMRVGNYPVHGQNVERCVKEVTAASQAVFGQWTGTEGWIYSCEDSP